MNSEKLKATSAIVGIVVLMSALFSPAIFGGKILAPLDITSSALQPWAGQDAVSKPYNHFPSDAVTQYLPYRMFAAESFEQDGYIGWNPYEMGGYNLAANTMALPASWTIQLHRFLNYSDAWNYGIIFEFLIAAFGMLVFLRSRNLPWLPCVIGTIAFALNAQFIVWIYHRWALSSFCWMPWVLWAYSDGFSSKSFTPKNFLLPVFLSLAFLGASLQHLAFIVLACVSIAASSFDFKQPLNSKKLITTWAAVGLLCMTICAFSLLPQIIAYFTNLSIGHTRGGLGYHQGYSQIPLHILLIPARIWPWLAGDPQSMDGWKLLKNDFMYLNYIGTIPMLLGFIGLFWKGTPKPAKWLIAVGILTPLTPLVGPLYHRVELLFILGASWMCAEMLVKIPTSTSARVIQKWWLLGVTALGLLLVVGACLPDSVTSQIDQRVVDIAVQKSDGSQFGDDKEWIKSRALEWTSHFSIAHPRTAWVYGLLLLGSAGFTLLTKQNHKFQSAGKIMILCATTLELGTLFKTWTTYSDRDQLNPANEQIEKIREIADSNRVIHTIPNTGYADLFAAPNLLAAQSIYSIDAYESIQYRSILTATKGEPDNIRLSLANVKIAIHPNGNPQTGTASWPVVGTYANYQIRENPAKHPFISCGTDTIPNKPTEIAASLQTATQIQPSQRTNNRLTFKLPAGQSWLRISQNWHKGWKWRIKGGKWQSFLNGSDASCLITSGLSPGGMIEIQFFPRPRWLNFVSALAGLLWIAYSLFNYIKFRRLKN